DSLSAFNLDRNALDPLDIKAAEVFFIGVSTDKYFWQDDTAAYYVMSAEPLIDGDFLLNDSFRDGWHTGWEIAPEQKEIAGYRCFKAVRNDIDVGADGKER